MQTQYWWCCGGEILSSGPRWRHPASKHRTSWSHDTAAFRRRDLSVCFTALEQHKEETSARKRKTTNATVGLIRWSHSQVALAPESGGPERLTETGLIPRGVGTWTQVLSLFHILLPGAANVGDLRTATKTSTGARKLRQVPSFQKRPARATT